jgi:hypothetical protein
VKNLRHVNFALFAVSATKGRGTWRPPKPDRECKPES